MVRHLHSRFLKDAGEYRSAVAFWRALWEEISSTARSGRGWQHPWLFTGSDEDTVFMDGNPIFSAYSPMRLCGIRVIQYPPESPDLEFDYWLDTFGGRPGEPGVIRELVIACALSEEAAQRAQELMEQWCQFGEVESRQTILPAYEYSYAASPFALALPC
jgi:hypothetical protein